MTHTVEIIKEGVLWSPELTIPLMPMSWMCEDYGFTAQEAYLLLWQVLEARCTMLHGDDVPFSPYVAKIKKKYLKAYKDFNWSGPEE